MNLGALDHMKRVLFFGMIPSASVRSQKMQLSDCRTLAEGMFVWAEHSGVLPKKEQKRHSNRGQGVFLKVVFIFRFSV